MPAPRKELRAKYSSRFPESTSCRLRRQGTWSAVCVDQKWFRGKVGEGKVLLTECARHLLATTIRFRLRWLIISRLFTADTKQFALFLATTAGLYKGTLCFLRHLRASKAGDENEERRNSFIAGMVASLA